MIPRVYIDPGHSSVDPGAVGYEVERDLNEKVSQYQSEHLLATYICETKVGDISINSTSKVVAEANAWKANLLVSNHFNAGKGDGYEALVHSEKRRELGEIFEKHVKAAGQNSRGVKLRPNLVVLKNSNMPAILNEGAFVDTKKDIQDWNEEHELKKLGIAYAEATAEYLQLEKKAVEPEKPQTVSVELPILRRGVESIAVKALQTMLNGLSCPCGSVDGDFGSSTEKGVKAFQKKVKLPQTGIVDAATWQALWNE